MNFRFWAKWTKLRVLQSRLLFLRPCTFPTVVFPTIFYFFKKGGNIKYTAVYTECIIDSISFFILRLAIANRNYLYYN